MKAPWIVVVAYAAAFGPIAAAAANRPLPPARRWVLAWLLLHVAFNGVGIILALNHINNHFISHIVTPFQGALILWALSLWQTRQLAALTMRLIIPIFVIAWAVSFVTVENVDNFSTVAEPVYSMLALGAVLYTLVSRSMDATEPLLTEDWFWICTGFALSFGSLALLLPLAAALLGHDNETLGKALTLRLWIEVVAFACITRGFLCRTPSTRSGAFSSPA